MLRDRHELCDRKIRTHKQRQILSFSDRSFHHGYNMFMGDDLLNREKDGHRLHCVWCVCVFMWKNTTGGHTYMQDGTDIPSGQVVFSGLPVQVNVQSAQFIITGLTYLLGEWLNTWGPAQMWHPHRERSCLCPGPPVHLQTLGLKWTHVVWGWTPDFCLLRRLGHHQWLVPQRLNIIIIIN